MHWQLEEVLTNKMVSLYMYIYIESALGKEYSIQV